MVDYNCKVTGGGKFTTIPSPDGTNRTLASFIDVGVSVWMDPRDVDVTINGTAIAKGLESLMPVLVYAIKGPLEKEITLLIVEYMDLDVNQYIQKGNSIRHPI